MVKCVGNVAEFDAQLASGATLLVDFYADWCGPCKAIAPKLEEMAQQYSSIVFLKVNVDDLDEIAARYEVSAMPTFMIFKGGKKVDTLVGANVGALNQLAAKYA
ncbi:hypothetical protein CAPTEDRAFT_156442 [Capitella teleta]|uniref:Thioredoxin n=1 Tax=Capitella teleta TaxID=283909 RepID=R7UZ51_CAPTE|nr:hypothetical protein CAPTEDRAFT_156442 [Capitella teleta]|eukprot:ELU09227.1 hypothetical protein CAPTEDRAFT_156442 [Capitella teleta]